MIEYRINPEIKDKLPLSGVVYRRPASFAMDIGADDIHARVKPPAHEGLGTSGMSAAYVHPEIRRAGVLLRETRELHGVTPSGIMGQVHLNGNKGDLEYLASFEAGLIPNPFLDKLINAAEKYIDPEDLKIRELKEIQTSRTEERKWLWRLTHGMSSGQAIRMRYLASGQTQETFAKKAGVSANTLKSILNGNRTPNLSTLNLILEKDNFSQRFPKVSQLIRFEAGETEDTEDVEDVLPRNVDGFWNMRFGQRITYMRRQQGLSRRQLGIDAGQKGAETWVGYVENGKIANVRPANKVKLFTALHVPPQLFEYLDGINGNIPPSIYTLLRDSFYFTEDNPPESEPPFSREDILMANALRDADSFGAGLYKMRTSMGLYPREVTFQRKHTRRIEEGDEIPNDYLIARTTSWFGFHVLDETTQVLLDLAARDRRKRVTA